MQHMGFEGRGMVTDVSALNKQTPSDNKKVVLVCRI